MRKTIPLMLLLLPFFGFVPSARSDSSNAAFQQSVIMEVEASACMGQDKSRNETRRDALTEARKKAAEEALTYVKSKTKVESGKLESDVIEAYANAGIKTIATLDEGWYREKYGESLADECYRVRIKAEVIPDVEAMRYHSSGGSAMADDPSAPLNVRVWMKSSEYHADDEIKLYLKGNKPFFARIIYRDAAGQLTQLLPNLYRSDNYFAGGVIYEFPSGEDRFQVRVSPPFGEESITVYAATGQLGDLSLSSNGAFYTVRESEDAVAEKVRGVKPMVQGQGNARKDSIVEFAESPVKILTRP